MLDVVGCMKFWVGDGSLVHHHCNSSYFRPRTTTMFVKKTMVHSLERNMRIKLYQYALTIGKSSYRHFAGICQSYYLTCCKVGRIGAACARSSAMPFRHDATCSPTTQHIPAIQEQDYQKHFLPAPTFSQDGRPTD
jgi:hypothetical protein